MTFDKQQIKIYQAARVSFIGLGIVAKASCHWEVMGSILLDSLGAIFFYFGQGDVDPSR